MKSMMRKIALLGLLGGISLSIYADIVTLKADLTQLAQPLQTQCKGVDYLPLKVLGEFLKSDNSEKIDVYQMDVIFVSDFLGYLDNKNCALAASDFTIAGVKILNQYRDLWEKDLAKDRKVVRYETYLAAGEASLVKYKWTHNPQYLDDADHLYKQYLQTSAISKQQKAQCGKKCSDDLVYLNQKQYFRLSDYASISYTYHQLFDEIYRQYSDQDPNFTDVEKSLNAVFERTDQFEVNTIQTTGLKILDKHVATLDEFKTIFNSGDKDLIEIFTQHLDQYLQNRIVNKLLDPQMTEKIYQFLVKEFAENNSKILPNQLAENQQTHHSFQIGKHQYIFSGDKKHLQLSSQPMQ
ncbi:hypothetical protein [Acinetobacter bereziniae]|uniref:hypothetical protein n=1 Tax=Acinetobacter bereziniae TaxID=106648 RepID=UPI0019010C4F|nr:hypothetical protein [Acinetobacter bereziniae]MBJ8551854.1 hypothetical protein [Acinetobacter bereziniae]